MKRRAFVGGCWLGLRLLFLSLPFERCRIADEEEEETTVMLSCVVCSEVGVGDDDASVAEIALMVATWSKRSPTILVF